jgi:phospholipid-binding lipoprotein MlaA
MTNYLRIAILLIGFIIGSNAVAADVSNPNDPYEKFNRVMYGFNKGFDTIILKPISLTYVKIVPRPVVKGIGNFFNNIDTIPTVINDILQGNIYQATSDSWRFVINTSVGILGFFDVASMIGLEPNSEDFGLTLAKWGYKNSNYLVIPFLGPSTVRDGIAWPVNYQFFTIYPYIYPVDRRYQLYFMGVISRRADLLRFENVFAQAAVDQYSFMRDAYMQRRAYLIQRNEELGDPYLEKNSKLDPPRL